MLVKNLNENLENLEACLKEIENEFKYSFLSFTIDGKKGVIQLLERLYPIIPIQLCQFHQIKTIRTYLASKKNNFRLEVNKELKNLILTITEKETTEESFIIGFNKFNEKYKNIINEKTINLETNKLVYTHKNLRTAINSIKRNLPYLFTYKKEEYKHLKIPNTTNACDGKFGKVKTKLKNHSGLKLKRREKIFDELIK